MIIFNFRRKGLERLDFSLNNMKFGEFGFVDMAMFIFLNV